MARQEDLRTIRTRMRIKKAFAELISKKDLQHITVKELALKAKINRGTFYLHYADVYDIIEQTKIELEQTLAETLQTINCKLDSPMPLLDTLYQLVERDFWIYKAIINAKWSGQYTNTVKSIITETFLANCTPEKRDVPYWTYLLSFVISGAIGMFSDWVNNNQNISPAEVKDVLNSYVNNAFNVKLDK